MSFVDVAIKERWQFIEWLKNRYPALAIFAVNIDQALIRGRRMTINSQHGISRQNRQQLLLALKEYYIFREQLTTEGYKTGNVDDIKD